MYVYLYVYLYIYVYVYVCVAVFVFVSVCVCAACGVQLVARLDRAVRLATVLKQPLVFRASTRCM